METKVNNPKALKALQENIDNANNPQRRYTGNTGKRNSWVDYYENKTSETVVGVNNTPNVKRGRQRDIAFQDMKANDSYEQRSVKSSPSDTRLRSAAVKDAIARGVGDVKSGDRLTAEPTTKSRARLYERWGGKAFAADAKTGKIDTRITRDGGTINIRGEKGPAPNFKGMKGDLARMAIKNVMQIVGGPYLKGAMFADDTIAGMTGVRPSQKIKEGHLATQNASIKRRLEQGDRFPRMDIKF
jgi:hypothetical protein